MNGPRGTEKTQKDIGVGNGNRTPQDGQQDVKDGNKERSSKQNEEANYPGLSLSAANPFVLSLLGMAVGLQHTGRPTVRMVGNRS